MHNNDKAALIKSMNNLIKHIVISRQAQQEIFASLERKDFEKIINNLGDPIIYLRLISAQLIGELLHQSESLQQEFCQIMGVHFSNDSELIVSNNFDKIIQSYPVRVPQIFKLIKTHHQVRRYNPLTPNQFIWFINPEKETLLIQYLSKDQISDLIKSYQSLENPQQSNFDPMYCIFGVLTTSSPQSRACLKYIQPESTELRESSKAKHMFTSERVKPIFFEPYVLRTNKVLNQPASHFAKPHFVAKLNTENLTINYVATPAKTERFQQGKYLQVPVEKTSKKMSLNDNKRRLNMSQEQNMLKFTLNQSQKVNFINGSMSAKIKEKVRTQISKSSHLPDSNYNPIENTFIYTPVNNSNLSFRQDGLSLGSSLLAPSLKVKNIAMNGRQGWETSKNSKTFDEIPL